MKLSIVTTMYCSAPYLNEFYARICAAAEKITSDYEIIFVNDGSPDDSLDIAVALYEKDPKVRVIDLSRNFGHHKAIMTGLMHTKGDFVFLIDCDLEEEPELLGQFWHELKNSEDMDVIYGVQEKRKGQLFERMTGALFYKIMGIMSEWKVPKNSLTVRLMKNRYVRKLIEHRDYELFWLGLCVLTGFNQKPFIVNKNSKGSTTYTIGKRISNFVNAITSFSSKPLVFIFYFGTMMSFGSAVYIIYLILRKALLSLPVPGYASIIVSIWFIGGIVMLSLGVVGIYVSKIFSETKTRPYTIVKGIYQDDKKAEMQGNDYK